MSKNTIAGITTQLHKVQQNKAEYQDALAINHVTSQTLTAKELAAKANLTTTYENLQTIVQKLSAEQVNLQGALSNQSIHKGALGSWIENVKKSQENYDIVVNNQAIFNKNIKTYEDNIVFYKKKYATLISNKDVHVKNIELYDESIRSSQSSIQIGNNKKVNCLQYNSYVDEYIPKFQDKINAINAANQTYLSNIKQINECLPILVEEYGDQSPPGEVKPENYYYNKVIETKHRTSILGINADPYYTSHTERVFNQEGYNRAVAEANDLNKKMSLISDLKRIKTEHEQSVAHNNSNVSNLQLKLSELTQNKQINAENLRKIERIQSKCQTDINHLTNERQNEVKLLEQAELDITKYKQLLNNEEFGRQKAVESLERSERDITQYKTLLDKAIHDKENVEKIIAGFETQIAGSTALLAQYTEQKSVLEECIRAAKEEVDGISEATQISLKEEEGFRTKIAEADREINTLEIQLGELGEEGEEDLVAMTEGINLQEDVTGVGIDANQHEEVALTGNSLATDL